LWKQRTAGFSGGQQASQKGRSVRITRQGKCQDVEEGRCGKMEKTTTRCRHEGASRGKKNEKTKLNGKPVFIWVLSGSKQRERSDGAGDRVDKPKKKSGVSCRGLDADQRREQNSKLGSGHRNQQVRGGPSTQK